MGNKIIGELLSIVRSVVGTEYSDMDLLRALHMARNDATAAINIILDTPDFGTKKLKLTGKSSEEVRRDNWSKYIHMTSAPCSSDRSLSCISNGINGAENGVCPIRVVSDEDNCDASSRSEWWFVGCGDVAGLSTCKGRKMKFGDEVFFTFPSMTNLKTSSSQGKISNRGRRVVASPDILRFSRESEEIGRIPNEWARCILPLSSENKIRIEGFCKYAPPDLGIMDTIILSMRVYVNGFLLNKRHKISPKLAACNTAEETTIHPLPTLFKLLGLTPYKKADVTPDDLYTKKRSQNLKSHSGLQSSTLSKRNKQEECTTDEAECDNDVEISENDLDTIVGARCCSELQEMDPPSSLQCDLRPYQKQALFWMRHLEMGGSPDDAATTLHPCWDAYHLADKRNLDLFVNVFSGDATTEFPSTLQVSKGGILADAMGLGKTIMTIALLLLRTRRSPAVQSVNKAGESDSGIPHGNNLIICPMTLLGQWMSEIESHTQPGSLSAYIHYGQGRMKEAAVLIQYDVVITTYGVLVSEYSEENANGSSGLFSVGWLRVVLDEAHSVKSPRSQVSVAAAALTADCRWCLTGTPIQNSLEDVYSLLRFLRVEPWGNWAWWNKLVQKPFEEGDERGLKLVQSILRPIMLRRTKSSTDRDGRPILILPPAKAEVLYCEQTEAERDFYGALFKRSKVKFDQFVEEGRVLHNYASILEILLRLRQCCDHPFLVMSRADTQEYADLDKLARRFSEGGGCGGGAPPTTAYVREVVDELRKKGEEGECPICLESFEDAVLTPCAHRLCRECLLASWKSAVSGPCPVCRVAVMKQDLITAPTGSRFRVDVEKNWVESSKVTALLHHLVEARESGSKTIVFSQWTAFLDLLQVAFNKGGIPFLRLDGTLNQHQRDRVIQHFSRDPTPLVLLMSLKAGGVGINLTAASNAFILDPWWNPAVEEQAVMRIHRIGQTRPVNIKRFIVKGTVEERMMAVQARKQRLISGALTDDEVRSARIQELKMLFA